MLSCMLLWSCERNNEPAEQRLVVGEPVDVAVVTIIPAEYRAMLAHMDRIFPVAVPSGKANSFAWKGAEIDRPGGKAPLRLVIALAGEAGTTSGALAVLDTATTWRPEILVLAGVAGGLQPKVDRGDVLISQAVWGYEYGAIASDFVPRRDWLFQPHPVLLQAAFRYAGNWQRDITEIRPDAGGLPRHRVGTTASGNKVIETLDSTYVESVLSRLSDAASVEMEAAGAFAAVELLSQSAGAPALLMLRGISDIPNPRAGLFGDKPDRERWKRYAADSVAAFTKGFLRDALPNLEGADAIFRSDALIVTYSAQVCSDMGRRLHQQTFAGPSTWHETTLQVRAYTRGLQIGIACLDDVDDGMRLHEIIREVAPAAILLVDTALGIGAAQIGDVAVARLTVPFDHDGDRPMVRNADSIRSARALVAAALAVSQPAASFDGRLHVGAIAAGNASGKAMDEALVDSILAANPRTVAIDRESAAVVSALRRTALPFPAPLFLSIQGIDRIGGAADNNASAASASAVDFVMALLEHAWPIAPVGP